MESYDKYHNLIKEHRTNLTFLEDDAKRINQNISDSFESFRYCNGLLLACFDYLSKIHNIPIIHYFDQNHNSFSDMYKYNIKRKEKINPPFWRVGKPCLLEYLSIDCTNIQIIFDWVHNDIRPLRIDNSHHSNDCKQDRLELNQFAYYSDENPDEQKYIDIDEMCNYDRNLYYLFQIIQQAVFYIINIEFQKIKDNTNKKVAQNMNILTQILALNKNREKIDDENSKLITELINKVDDINYFDYPIREALKGLIGSQKSNNISPKEESQINDKYMDKTIADLRKNLIELNETNILLNYIEKFYRIDIKGALPADINSDDILPWNYIKEIPELRKSLETEIMDITKVINILYDSLIMRKNHNT